MSNKYRLCDFTHRKKTKQNQDIWGGIYGGYFRRYSLYIQQIQVQNIKLLVPRKLHKLHNFSCKQGGLQMLIHRATLPQQCPLFQAVGNAEFVGTLTLLKHCACTILMPFHFLSLFCPPAQVALPCSPLVCRGSSWGPSRLADSASPQSPLAFLPGDGALCPTRLLLCNFTPWLGLCPSPGRSDSKNPLPARRLPLLTTPW